MARARKTKENDLIDQMLDQVDLKGLSREEVLGQDGLLKQLTGKLLSKILEAEMDGHLGYTKHASAGDNRNGYSEKTVLTENQSAVIQVPRDRQGTFKPRIIPKYEKRVPLFNDQIISMYSFGMTARDIKAHIALVHLLVNLFALYPLTVFDSMVNANINALISGMINPMLGLLRTMYPVFLITGILVS
ncbi:MAG: transposase, partial [Prevotella sp.]|nr:transposase [Prevotella sp.]